ncbi:MAG: glycerol-3-phosphate 1-O-acyltransferase PlsY [Candidatus Omnitrophica bacterium]|jgi:glycerol-3-phosphate acyltransferase PlsY|nr:glycerol-3-phosphate 1-O-acyltransferase PlsY [Candidatus Omnitrophota bacterium]MDD5079171.1 glycerol-3-phosphate 1-O-acyltransferase PlsY [Candidatus Omnitrophota bacterium]
MHWIIPGTAVSYLIGSIPTAYIFGRLLKGIDIRKFGSGNVGATNALRILGKRAGIVVLSLDVLKGLLPVVLLGNFILQRTLFNPQVILIILGIACITGHNWPIFLNFKGGKGIATSLGVLLGLAIKIPGLGAILGMVLLIWLVVFLLSRIVSLASLAGAFFLPVFMLLFKQSILMFSATLILSIFVILRHKTNIIRLYHGQETRLKFKKTI